VIANDVSIRRAAEALESCASLAQFCQILHQCLEPIGFDGFGVYLSSEVPVEVERNPFNYASRPNLQFFLGSVTNIIRNKLEFDLQPDEKQRQAAGRFRSVSKELGISSLDGSRCLYDNWILQRSGSQAGENAGFLVW